MTFLEPFKNFEFLERNDMKRFIIIIFLLWVYVLTVMSQENSDSAGLNALSPDALQAVTALFKYDRSIPLDARILERYETKTYVHEKIVFTGVRGDRVPGYLAIPKTGSTPHPIVCLFHVSAGSKASWWDDMSFERGLSVTDTLLELGIAVLALDAQYHGERSINNDFLPIQQMYFDEKWVCRYRDGIIQTVGDYLRAVDYLSGRSEIDVQRIGVLGHSMGGVMAVLFSSLEKHVKALVASVAAYSEPWLFPLTPFNLADGVQAPTLLLAGRTDIIISIDATQKLFSSLKTDVKEMELYDSGHRLPRENINRSVGWLNEYLKKK